ncbi:ABC transporter A family member 7-like [Castanea sativa]|uniref:ABC transporter A family member 7-like n=1 Tax=Castanea sativa TaxID=21020 RepID=UPI003F64E1C6
MVHGASGTETMPGNPNYLDLAFFTRRPIYYVQPQCFLDSTSRVHIQVSFFEGQKAYDLLNSNESNFNVSIGYNSSNGNNSGGRFELGWVPRLVNLVMVTSLVYEKEQKLRITMKMHGLRDQPYWIISYAYFLAIFCAYIMCLG